MASSSESPLPHTRDPLAASARRAYWRGVVNVAPFSLVIIPFALLFGVVATEAGLDLLQTMSFSVLVIAGASQFTALQLMQDQAPILIVLATSLAVNLRMAMYSVAITPHLGPAPLWQRALMAYVLVDQTYATASLEYDRNPAMSLREKTAYFAGVVTPICPLWYGSTLVGAMFGTAIPPDFALDFALPITFLAMIAPALRTLPHVAAAAVSVVGTLALAWVPFSGGLLIAAVAAMVTGAQVELWLKRRMA
ncbi:MAG: branched-chain amino acid transporter AzlC [Cereibacter sphaeroides]|uniref:Branched-chain amino acid transporter AzlC n=1 Tax=Cereibacter sphaeroides TaxID=1063 RepID=A0A2W5S7V2_CERSP|nr:MAG: branched-chain amino acid transporter AzlC [Cereibacter sphaeroides]